MITFNYKAITQLRKIRNKLTVAEFAKRLDRNPRTISVWENSEDEVNVKIEIKDLLKMCNEFEVPITFFFKDDNPIENQSEIDTPTNPTLQQIITDFRNDFKEILEENRKEINKLHKIILEKEIKLMEQNFELAQKEREITTLKNSYPLRTDTFYSIDEDKIKCQQKE